jgi:hypothetical protein
MSAEQRFWAKVDTSGGMFACWPWTGAVSSRGYGAFDHRGAHRFALELALGRPIHASMYACHHCDNPPCVNPAHLFEGTPTDNACDRSRKGRTASNGGGPSGDRSPARLHPEAYRGMRNGRARLSEDDVRSIRARVATGRERWVDIARAFGVSKGTVAHIAARRTWQHVT